MALVDEPVVNKHVDTIDELDDIIGKRCVALANEHDAIKSRAGLHWWSKIANAKQSDGSRIRSPFNYWS